MFKNIFNNKEKEDKANYEYIKKEITNHIESTKINCKDDIDKKREFLYLNTGNWNVFTFTKEQLEEAFSIALEAYKNELINKQIIPRFGNYDWCEEKISPIKHNELKKGDEVLFMLYSDIYEEETYHDGYVVGVYEEHNQVDICYREGHHSRSDSFDYSKVIAKSDGLKGTNMKFDNYEGKFILLQS